MPAIHLPRLRRQASELAEKFSQPKVFVQELKDLLEFYSDRTRRIGKVGAPTPILQMYKVPDPVLRRIRLEMEPHIEAEPEKAFALVDALWEKPVFELRFLAICLLGDIPSSKHKPLLKRLQNWGKENQEDILLETMATHSLARLRVSEPEMMIQQVEKWLKSKKLNYHKLGLLALLAQITDTDYENLPVIYRLLRLLMPTAPKELRPYLRDLIRPLAHRSPLETAFFLRESLAGSSNPIIPWLIRHSLESFPKDVQADLRAALKG
jgi:hypothetical protein